MTMLKSKPSNLLLHYKYGVATVKCWGCGTEALQNRADPRPALGSIHDRGTAIHKLEESRNHGGAGTGGLMESQNLATSDEDEVRNWQVAKERQLKKVGKIT